MDAVQRPNGGGGSPSELLRYGPILYRNVETKGDLLLCLPLRYSTALTGHTLGCMLACIELVVAARARNNEAAVFAGVVALGRLHDQVFDIEASRLGAKVRKVLLSWLWQLVASDIPGEMMNVKRALLHLRLGTEGLLRTSCWHRVPHVPVGARLFLWQVASTGCDGHVGKESAITTLGVGKVNFGD